MRHHHRFSRSHYANDTEFTGHGRPSLHALWHALSRHAALSGERFDHRFSNEADWQDDQNTMRDRAERGAAERSGDFERRRGERDEFGSRHRAHHDSHHDSNQGRGHNALHALWHAIGRHHEHRGGGRGGRFGGGPGGFGGGDGDGFPRGRKFTSEDLQLLLLSLIEAQPSHGYELIKALETRSNGFYSPSPGMVYPALTYLEELGYVTVQLEGNRKRYELAETGREYLAANRDRVELMLARLTHIARKMDSVRRAFAGEEAADISEGGWLPELTDARRALKHALLRRDNAPAGEQRRIAAILMRAATEIESDGKTASASGDQPA